MGLSSGIQKGWNVGEVFRYRDRSDQFEIIL
jgi:hypothetical protein